MNTAAILGESYALPSFTPEDFLQDAPVSILVFALPDLTYSYEPFENPSGIQSSQEIETTLYPSFLRYDPVPSSPSPQTAPLASDAASPCTIYSILTPLEPAPASGQNATGYPSNWRTIPQKVYGWGKRRWDYRPSEPILFHVDGLPGVNMGDALRNLFTGLDGRDDPMFQGGVEAFSCRLMVRSRVSSHILRELTHPSNSLATHSTVNRR